MRTKKVLPLLFAASACLAGLLFLARPVAAQSPPGELITRPVISADVSALEAIAPVA